MSRAFIKFEEKDIQDGLFQSVGFTELFVDLPNDAVITAFIQMNGHTIFHIESASFIHTSSTQLLPEIIPNIKRYASGLSPSIISLDMSAALAAYSQQGNQPQGPQTSGTVPGSLGVSPGSSSPTQATPSPWGQITFSNSHTMPSPGIFKRAGTSIHMDIETSNGKFSCQHKWKSYQGLNEMFDYCEICNVKKS